MLYLQGGLHLAMGVPNLNELLEELQRGRGIISDPKNLLQIFDIINGKLVMYFRQKMMNFREKNAIQFSKTKAWGMAVKGRLEFFQKFIRLRSSISLGGLPVEFIGLLELA